MLFEDVDGCGGEAEPRDILDIGTLSPDDVAFRFVVAFVVGLVVSSAFSLSEFWFLICEARTKTP